MYIVMAMQQHLTVEMLGCESKIPLIYIDGMIGTLPVFKYKKDAQKYAGTKSKIIKMKEIKTAGLHYLRSQPGRVEKQTQIIQPYFFGDNEWICNTQKRQT